MSMLFRFTCGHVGRENEPPPGAKRAQVRAFIRVAEIRDQPVTPVAKNCPDCK
jgi:hypothetical protein